MQDAFLLRLAEELLREAWLNLVLVEPQKVDLLNRMNQVEVAIKRQLQHDITTPESIRFRRAGWSSKGAITR